MSQLWNESKNTLRLLICGYIRENYAYRIHHGLSDRIILFYEDIFKWKVYGNELTEFLSSRQMKLESDTFYFEDIQFTCYLIKGLRFIGFCWRITNLGAKRNPNAALKVIYQMECKQTKTIWKYSRIVLFETAKPTTKDTNDSMNQRWPYERVKADGYGWPYECTLSVSGARICAEMVNALTFECKIIDCVDIRSKDSKCEMNPLYPDGYILEEKYT
eukprot:218507_1